VHGELILLEEYKNCLVVFFFYMYIVAFSVERNHTFIKFLVTPGRKFNNAGFVFVDVAKL